MLEEIDQGDGGLVDLFMPSWKAAVLRKLVEKTDYEFTIRELAQQTPGSYGAVRKFVHKLAEHGVIRRHKKGNSILISYDPDNRYNSAITSLLRTETQRLREIAEEYAEELYNAADHIQSIVLFGSVAKGTATPSSDIDILIIPNPDVSHGGKFKEAVEKKSRKVARTIQNKYGVTISPLVEGKEEFRNELAHGRRFEQEVARWGELLRGEKLPKLWEDEEE